MTAAFIGGAYALKLLTVGVSGAVGLAFPDVDLRVQRVLRHRSVVTHNVFIPMLFLLAGNPDVRLAATGLVLGASIHLAADVLSRPVGFGRVWFPQPFKLSLGAFSPWWLAGNALAGLVVSRVALTRAPMRMPLAAYVVLAGVFALGYAVWHERSVRAFLSFTLIFCLGFALLNWASAAPWLRPLLRAAG